MGEDDLFGLVGGRLDGKYDVASVVARGGFGVVYRGEHRNLHRPVAVKVLVVPEELSGSLRAQFLEKFALEARTIARLEHPAVVRVLDFGASPMPQGEAAPWMVLEWLDGTTLDAALTKRRGAGGRSPAEALALLRPVFDALAHAHDEGVVHRDIKPGNLMLVATKRGEPTLKLLDFGIAKVMSPDEGPRSGQTHTETRLRAFSLHYAAPEQLSGTRTGPWTDVYALALVLTEVLTDAAPYAATEPMEVYAEAMAPQRPTPARRGVDVGAWEPVLQRATALRPAERFAHARDLLAALEAALPGADAPRAPASASASAALSPAASAPTEPVLETTLRPTTLDERLPERPPSRRTKVLVGGAVVALAGLAALVTASLRAPAPASPTAPPPHVATARRPEPLAAPSPAPAPAPVPVPAPVPAPVVAEADAGGAPVARPTADRAPRRGRSPRGRRAPEVVEPAGPERGRIHAE